jgi:photosynthetic reaction center cytochrome c subunit
MYHFAMRIALALLIAIPLFAQDPPAPGGAPKGGPPKGGARPAPKNLKILKPEEVRPAMGAFRVALGQQCTFCHMEGDFASDENPLKEVARKMILMTRDINSKFPNGGNNVSCYTCHRGAMLPLTAPPAAADAPKPPAD